MNKPYCWLLNGEVWFKEPKETDKEFDGYEITPLYAHQAELTDEEIKDCLIEWAKVEHADEYSDPTTEELEPIIRMIRAILDKAQEK